MENGAGPFPSVWIILESRDDPDIARRVLIEVKGLPPASKRRFDLRLSPMGACSALERLRFQGESNSGAFFRSERFGLAKRE